MIDIGKYKSLGTEIENANEEVVDKVVAVDINKIIPNEKNFYNEAYEINSLAEQINMSGQLEPIIITPDYKLISGHRRYNAIKQLGNTTINCRILKDIADEDDEQLKLIQANAYRTKSPEEVKNEVLILTEIYTKKYEAGEISKGAITLLTADDLGKSQRQVQRLAKELKEEITQMEIKLIKHGIDLENYNRLKASDELSLKAQHEYLSNLVKQLNAIDKVKQPKSKQEKLNDMVLKLSNFIEKNNDEITISKELYDSAIDHVVTHNQTKLDVR